jgi:hypothetical protein
LQPSSLPWTVLRFRGNDELGTEILTKLISSRA